MDSQKQPIEHSGSSDCSTAITHSKVDVLLRGDHPHSGKVGWIPLQNGEPETINMLGRLMAKVEFPDGSGCYAELRHLSRI